MYEPKGTWQSLFDQNKTDHLTVNDFDPTLLKEFREGIQKQIFDRDGILLELESISPEK
jgi:hypothetical protein